MNELLIFKIMMFLMVAISAIVIKTSKNEKVMGVAVLVQVLGVFLSIMFG